LLFQVEEITLAESVGEMVVRNIFVLKEEEHNRRVEKIG
jgi:hypothetical protein